MRFFIPLFLFLSLNICFADQIEIIYTSPVNNAKYIRVDETIILSANEEINISSLNTPNLIQVLGNNRGLYQGTIKLATDNKSIIYTPDLEFMLNEVVTVTLNHGITTLNGNSVNPISFTFSVRDTIAKNNDSSLEYILKGFDKDSRLKIPLNDNPNDTLPPYFPAITILNSTNPSYGRLFFSNFNIIDFQGGTHHSGNGESRTLVRPLPHIIISENSGDPVFYKKVNRYAVDFKKVSTNRLVYFDVEFSKYIVMDTNYNVIDSFKCGNGYPTDQHELVFDKNGHALLMSYDPVRLDMSSVIPGGDSNATVTGLVIQELDLDKNVIFQWRSWDHIEITDATHEDLLSDRIDYIHGNSIEPDLDGNLIISSRHLDEVTKINRATGNIMWRLGGENNEFTFLNDTIPFSHQHDARRVAPGRITIFDNGNFRNGFPYSRVIEYELDEVNKTAKLVWEFNHNKEIFGFAMGNAHRLPNGNTVIGWGTGYPNITEVDPNGNIVFEMVMPDTLWTYRAFKFTINQPDVQIPDDFTLSQNYPNPFNPITNINFDIINQGLVTLKVYDILGREIAQLVNENLNPGSYNILWNAGNFSSGIYFYTLTSGDFIDTKKLVLVR